MILCIPDVVNQEEQEKLKAGLADVTYVDGAVTGGWHSNKVKNNRELTPGMPGYAPLETIVRDALMRNAMFRMGVRPRFLPPVLFSRYEIGMTYGRHVDDATMTYKGSSPEYIRTDVSYTLFLSDPKSYQGGELVVEYEGAENPFKLSAGSLIAYPTGTLHRVAPITQGVRLAAVGWVQSEVRDPQQRSILFDLDRARRSLFAREGKSETFDLLTKSHANLLRLWVEL